MANRRQRSDKTITSSPALKVYPNPFSNELKLKIFTEKKEDIKIRITNMQGRTVFQTTKHADTGEQEFNLNFLKYSLPDGLYIMELISGDKHINKKTMKICRDTGR